MLRAMDAVWCLVGNAVFAGGVEFKSERGGRTVMCGGAVW